MIETKDLSKIYGSYAAVDHLNLSVMPGEIFCLLGANGAGKSTTIGLLLNFIAPTRGSAYINGIDVVKEPILARKSISYIPENLMLYPKLSGLENLEFFCRISGNMQSREELKQLLIQTGFNERFVNQRVETYSKGMRQKVGIAITRAKKSKVLLLDEPTSGLDPQASNEFSNLLTEMASDGVAILMATHDLFRARALAHKIGIMRSGALIETIEKSAIQNTNLEDVYLNHMKA